MATTTTNFGWDIPQSTDLVKDGATAIAALGQDIDTAFIDLKGGTTGQILSKASATDLDYTWVNPNPGDITAVTAGTGISGGGTSGDVTITNSMATAITTAGDLIKGTGAGTFDRLGIGSTGQVLTVSGGAPVWATPAGGGKVLQVVQGYTTTVTAITSTTMTDSGITATITPSSTSSKILILAAVNARYDRTSSTESTHGARIMRGATEIITWKDEQFRMIGGASATLYGQMTSSMVYLDSPASTSALTYKIQGKVGSTTNSNTLTFQATTTPSTIVLMEIGA